MYDMVIIGAGPAGLSAAIYGKRAGLDMLVLEKEPTCGGQILITYEVDNYPGLPGIGGFELGMKFREHADKLGVNFEEGEVTGLSRMENGKTWKVVTDRKEYETKTVVIAVGATHNKLGIPGEEELRGRGVSYCATCDGAFFRGKTAIVNGGGDVAVEDAIFLARGCSKVYLVHRRDELRAAKILQDELMALDNVEIVWNSVIHEVAGENGKVDHVTVENVKDGVQSRIDTDALFVAIGIHPLTDVFDGIVDMDENGYIIAGEDMASSAEGIFVAGDARKKRLRQIVTAVSDGAVAVTAVSDYLMDQLIKI